MKPKQSETKVDETPIFDVMPGATPFEEEDLDALDAGDDFNPETTLETKEDLADEETEQDETDEPAAEEIDEDTSESEEGGEPTAESDADGEQEDADTADSAESLEAGEDSGDAPAKKTNIMVPKTRLDETLAKLRAAQKKLDSMAAQTPNEDNAPEQYDFSKAEIAYQEALMDGRTEDATKIRSEMREADRKELRNEFNETVQVAKNTSRQEDALSEAALEIQALYPQLDQGHESFDEASFTQVIELRDAFIIKGTAPLLALENAVRYVAQTDGLIQAGEEHVQEAARTDELARKRKKSLTEKLQAANKQPSKLEGAGNRGRSAPEIDLSNMSDEEFDALPEATLKRLQGDFG